MADTIKVYLDCFAPHKKAPEYIKGTTTFILSNEDFDLIEKYKRACNGNDKENFIPVLIRETKTGKNMLFLDTYKLNFQIQQESGVGEEKDYAKVENASMNARQKHSDTLRSREDSISIEDVPF